MFNSKNRSSTDSTTIIASDVTVRGDVHFSGALHVEGAVEGCITADNEGGALFTLNRGGCVRGEVHVPNAVVDGEVIGNIHCGNRLEVAAGARIEGDVHYKVLELAAGAAINGRMVHESGQPRQLTQDGDDAAADPDDEAGGEPVTGVGGSEAQAAGA